MHDRPASMVRWPLSQPRPNGTEQGRSARLRVRPGTADEHPNLPMSGRCASVYLCICLHVANVGSARQFSVMSFPSDAPNEYVLRRSADDALSSPLLSAASGWSRRRVAKYYSPGLL